MCANGILIQRLCCCRCCESDFFISLNHYVEYRLPLAFLRFANELMIVNSMTWSFSSKRTVSEWMSVCAWIWIFCVDLSPFVLHKRSGRWAKLKRQKNNLSDSHWRKGARTLGSQPKKLTFTCLNTQIFDTKFRNEDYNTFTSAQRMCRDFEEKNNKQQRTDKLQLHWTNFGLGKLLCAPGRSRHLF